jgi:copper chaperone CopZ
MLLPSFASSLLQPRQLTPHDPVGTEIFVLGIEGMTCAGCEPAVEAALARVPGVSSAEASFDKQQALVSVSRASAPSRLALSTAVGALGYHLVALAEATPSSRDDVPLAGHWVGDIPIEGQTPTLVMDVDRMGTRWVGEFDVEAFGVQDYPVHVQIAEQQVTLEFTAAEAEFRGTINGDKMAGTIDFDGRKIDVTFRRTGSAVFSAQFLRLEAAADDSTRVQTLSRNGEELRGRFNADRSKTRLVMLLAPT